MSLKLAEARARAELIHGVDTVIHLDLTSTERYSLDATITFQCTKPGALTFLELTDATDLTVEGAPATYDGTRIAISDLAAHNSIRVRARMPYVTDGDGMTAVTDPADGERYVSGFTAMDIAQKVIPCFDQPDLKSSFTVSVTAPNHWKVLANGLFQRREGDTWFFAKTPRFSSYIFFVCAGPYFSIEWNEPYEKAQGGTLPFGWHARASQKEALLRDIDDLKFVTSRAFAYYTQTFDEPYPFADYQQVFTPGLNWGAMEFPGCVAFRDEYLTPGTPTALQRHGMNSVIAHEMAHMWFGDLVTMTWWEDSWLNESFADYMGYEVSGRATGADAWTAAALGRKPTAYRADSRRSTHPIAEDAENLVDVDTAFANFDMITYAKGNSVLRQLVTWLGEEDFIAGVNVHLSAHPFGNATLADFLDALSSATDRDVRAWAELWLRTTGFDTIRVTRDGDVPVLTRVGSRPHRFVVAGFTSDGTLARERLVDLADEDVRLDDFTSLAVLPNAIDQTYAAIALDDVSRETLDAALGKIERPLTRAVLWATAAFDVESGHRTAGDLARLALEQLVAETDPTVFEGATALLLRTISTHSTVSNIGEHLELLARLAESVSHGERTDLHAAAERLFAVTGSDTAALRARLEASTDQAVRWMYVTRLAALGVTETIGTEAERDKTTAGAHAALKATAAVPTADAKAAAWQRLLSGELSNREFSAVAAGFWGVEQGVLVADLARQAPEQLAALAVKSGQAMGQLIGQALPQIPLPDQSTALVASLRATLAEGTVPTVAARGFNDVLDDLERMRTAKGA